ncbi:MAG: STAS domain-containing protein [Candidatus Delongbacteria bacterium]|nr:STAS domain-containing protein [Candidatus Delongbacteria bacterium]
MEINTRAEGDVTVIRVEGNLIGGNTNQLSGELMKCITEKRVNILVNLAHTAQMDSYSIGVLASTGSELSKLGGVLKFTELQPFIENLFEMMRMTNLFETYDTETDAIRSFRAADD